MPRFPLKKIRKQLKLLLLLVFLTFAVWFTYLHIHQGKVFRLQFSYGKDAEKQVEEVPQKPPHEHRLLGDATESQEEERGYKGQANLHVFEDWCGSSVSQLRKNIHFPLYPHSRTTVKKLAVSPKWKNYGLRIFGFIHPYRDGDFQFAISSDDNSELWMSSDTSPLNAHLLAFVGMRGCEWTAPGEFTKFRSQTSEVIHLAASRRYYFEVLHKQDDRGSDHVEVAWRPFLPGLKFDIIDSAYISLYTDESSLMMDNVSHIPQTLASHAGQQGLRRLSRARPHTDMLTSDPRDTFYHIPMISESRLLNVLPSCLYSPTYVLKDFPIARYQGLQFVYLSFVYPNDFTRLSHMEKNNKCFYKESPMYLEKYGFYKYMKMDEEEDDTPFFFPNPDDFLDEEEGADPEEERLVSDKKPIRREKNPRVANHTNSSLYTLVKRLLGNVPWNPAPAGHSPVSSHTQRGEGAGSVHSARPQTPESGERSVEVMPGIFVYRTGNSAPLVHSRHAPPGSVGLSHPNAPVNSHTLSHSNTQPTTTTRPQPDDPSDQPEDRPASSWSFSSINHPGSSSPSSAPPESRPTPGLNSSENSLQTMEDNQSTRVSRASGPSVSQPVASDTGSQDSQDSQGGGTSEYSYEEQEDLKPDWEETEINWQRTFSANTVDFETLRSDWNDLRCNVSGNLQLAESEALDLVAQYMERLNKHNGGIYTLRRIVNVEKRRDSARGNRFLLELVLLEGGKREVRVSEYVYLLLRRSRLDDSLETREGGAGAPSSPPTSSALPPHPASPRSPVPSRSSVQERATLAWGTSYAKPLLCQPSVLHWRRDVMVHFVVPVKNQARWVVQFISDMEALRQETQDDNFRVVIVDFHSEDMDVERALRESSVPSYEYLRRTGRFERAAGLQAGVDSIQDSHSIVFLCDLHIHFPAMLLESIRKHCVEGRLAFAPIVMRLNCGATPQEPEGYWEVNGFGLLGLYKSDFDRVGGMNTEEFKERWGGEDWELLDRVLQNGLEVERLRLRNFFHYFHSKRGMWNSQTNKVPKD
ncbi:N-acetyl-beta-glucosaminyl-glycoprotein 4-beta-N-acetylgalactosaminyltransferase 1-like [Alosa pseudoharengus]|uniref:N-acetyl-beta-glucosaminyl-glycoprotein 4-beta-N-acetylgalactosaminyltransferase 1-like n=1 Tax=Alosa pseudoharengus TaxID=34774 RepID=UPI003F88CDCF